MHIHNTHLIVSYKRNLAKSQFQQDWGVEPKRTHTYSICTLREHTHMCMYIIKALQPLSVNHSSIMGENMVSLTDTCAFYLSVFLTGEQ